MDKNRNFHTIDGKDIKNFEEMIETVKSMNDSVFNYHVNDKKNDFYNWIRDVLKMYDLAEDIKNIYSKSHFLIILKKYRDLKVFVINSGSSSLKFQLIDPQTEISLIKGMFDCMGTSRCVLTISAHGQTVKKEVNIKSHDEAVGLALKSLTNFKIINDYSEISVIGHRVVHGGEKFTKPQIINDEVIAGIKKYSEIAPLHNPANLSGILACKKLLPGKKQIAVFDTAFHSTIPKMAFLYGIPYELYESFGIRKYGFHGISNKYITRKASELLDKESHEMIVCHLGNGSSITAIKDGLSMDTSMGFTPLDGLIMGTRSGEIDPEIILFLIKKHYSIEQLETLLNKKSGLRGITGMTSDVRELREAALSGNRMAELALDMLAYRITMFIGGYMTILHGLDCLVFTGGIGENAWYIRENVCSALEFAGLKLDNKKNKNNETEIHAEDSKIKVFVIPTNEELEIARECMELDQSINYS